MLSDVEDVEGRKGIPKMLSKVSEVIDRYCEVVNWDNSIANATHGDPVNAWIRTRDRHLTALAKLVAQTGQKSFENRGREFLWQEIIARIAEAE
jgi:hypothetical protein